MYFIYTGPFNACESSYCLATCFVDNYFSPVISQSQTLDPQNTPSRKNVSVKCRIMRRVIHFQLALLFFQIYSNLNPKISLLKTYILVNDTAELALTKIIQVMGSGHSTINWMNLLWLEIAVFQSYQYLCRKYAKKDVAQLILTEW